MLVPRVRTPLSEIDLVLALREGHKIAFGTDPNQQRLGVAWAQVALEHARGAALDRFCVGNVTAFSWPGDYYVLRVDERVSRNPDKWQTLELKFRAYPTAAEGAAGYWRLLAGRYLKALAFFDSGKPGDAAYTLSNLGYYTALPGPYASTMVNLYAEFGLRLAPKIGPCGTGFGTLCTLPEKEDRSVPILTDEELAKVYQSSVAALADLSREAVDEASRRRDLDEDERDTDPAPGPEEEGNA